MKPCSIIRSIRTLESTRPWRNDLGKPADSQTQFTHLLNGLKFSPCKIVARIKHQQDGVSCSAGLTVSPKCISFPFELIKQTAPDNSEHKVLLSTFK